MLQKDVLEIYKSMFDLGEIDVWFANGFNSVRVRYVDNKEVVFTYRTDLDWKLETLDSFILSIGKAKKMTKKELKNWRG